MIEDARNELEKAYGLLFAILNYRARLTRDSLRIEPNDFKAIDNVMATYPWMFSDEINELWRNTRRPEPVLYPAIEVGRTEPLHNVSFDFRNRINEEYHRRVKKYMELLGKT